MADEPFTFRKFNIANDEAIQIFACRQFFQVIEILAIRENLSEKYDPCIVSN